MKVFFLNVGRRVEGFDSIYLSWDYLLNRICTELSTDCVIFHCHVDWSDFEASVADCMDLIGVMEAIDFSISSKHSRILFSIVTQCITLGNLPFV